MKLYDIISNLKFVGIKNYRDIEIDSLSCNSKETVNSGIYFCIKGLKVDGHDFATESIKNGATCLVVERYLDVDLPQILVENVRGAMSYIASIFYGTYKSKMKFVGITGTNGKTTTTYILRDVLNSFNKKVGVIGTNGIFINSLKLPNSLTTPDPIELHKTIKEMEENGCEYCVMEVSAHAIALNKIDDIHYDCVGLTNITKDHLDFFLNMENYASCKASLFDYKHAKTGVINTDSKLCKEIAKKSKLPITTIGKDAKIKLISFSVGFDGMDIVFSNNDKTYYTHSNLVGEFNAYNLMVAIACLSNLDFTLDEISEKLKNIESFVPGRLNVMQTNTPYKVIVDYAHTPDGIANVLSSINKLKKGHLITVFGCGGNRDKTKRPEMGRTAGELSDFVIVTSDNPRCENPDMIIDDIVHDLDNKNMVCITDRRSAIEYALSIARENDIVAILGKGAENYQEIQGVKHHFSDYEVVENYLKYSLKGELD